jgi:pimeloyl-ACP methyl ester carboxylesterase
MATRQPLVGELHRVGISTLVICGENDQPFLDASRKMHEAIPGSRLEIIQGAGHSPQTEAPAAFNALILEFLSEVHETAAA